MSTTPEATTPVQAIAFSYTQPNYLLDHPLKKAMASMTMVAVKEVMACIVVVGNQLEVSPSEWVENAKMQLEKVDSLGEGLFKIEGTYKGDNFIVFSDVRNNPKGLEFLTKLCS